MSESTKQKHKRWRKQFNEDCLKRDKHKCVFCDIIDSLQVHHINDRHVMPHGGYTKSNGITVCDEHHLCCEQFHMTGIVMEGYNPDDLYKKISSSYEQAYNDCLNLK